MGKGLLTKVMNTVNAVVLEVLARAFRVVYRRDKRLKEEIQRMNSGLKLKLTCGPDGPVLALQQDARCGMRKIQKTRHADVDMQFKSAADAFRVMTGQIGISDAYAKHLFYLKGDIYQTMGFVRSVNLLEAYLFPKFWSRRFLDEVPKRRIPFFLLYLLIVTA